MNTKMIKYILGYIMRLEAFLLICPMFVSILYKEATVYSFLITIAVLFVLGFTFSWKKPENVLIYSKEGFVIVALAWILLSLFGALPFYLSGEIPSYVDCFFETVSSFTTTGSSILKDVEKMSRGLLFWRSLTHWIGGMGVLVFILAIDPLANSRSIHLLRAEATGPTVGKLVPKLKTSAKILYAMYIVLTIIEIIFLLCGGMPLFDSIVNSFATAGTGGFAIKNSSIAYYNSTYTEMVISIFMIIFGINFNVFFLILIKQFKLAFRSEELRWYLGIILIATIFIAINILPIYNNSLLEALRYSFFQVSSIISTTGFATTDFNLWPEFSKGILFILMVIGSCAGSTAGGIKVIRFVILLKSIKHEIRHMLHPKSISAIKFENKPVSSDVIHGINTFFSLYFFIILISFLLISIDNFDFESSFTSVISAINNVGPAFGIFGPVSNFSEYSDFSKIVLSLNMLIGRLEIFPVIMLFSSSIWRKKHQYF